MQSERMDRLLAVLTAAVPLMTEEAQNMLYGFGEGVQAAAVWQKAKEGANGTKRKSSKMGL